MEAVPAIPPILEFETLDSTNLEAKRRLAQGRMEELWLRADRQTAGYGRRGRGWVMAAGNLACSRILAAPEPVAALGQLSFVAALAVADAMAGAVGEGAAAEIRLKWPNDVLIGGAKAAGVLLELVDTPAGRRVVIGIGVNLAGAPALDRPTARLGLEERPPPSPRAFLEMLALAFELRLGQWRGRGFAPIRADWLARAYGRGAPMQARMGDRLWSGVFRDLDDHGALILETQDGDRLHIGAGDVVFAPGES